MKSLLRTFLLTAAGMLLIPSAVLLPHVRPEHSATESDQSSAENTRFYKVLLTSAQTVQEIPVRDYLIGAVAAEMPADYAHDALCAQVIASHTYAERMRLNQKSNPDPTLNGADFSDDGSLYQAFYKDAQLHTLWGSRYDANRKKITDAVDAVGDLVLYYDNAPITAAFHAISAGKTESAKDIWGADLPYLVSVSSEYDTQAPQYVTIACFSPQTLSASIQAVRRDIILPDSPSAWFGALSATEAGTVLQAAVGSGSMTGDELRDALALRSACFSVRYDSDSRQFVFTVHGYGHLVGLSQFGADRMAASGASYDEILLHYYPGTSLRRQ